MILELGIPAFNSLGAHSAVISAIIIFEGSARYIETIFDATLEQRRTQISTATRTLVKLALIAGLALYDGLTLATVLAVELATATLGAIIATMLFRGIPRAKEHESTNNEFPGWLGAFKFIGPAFCAQLLGIFYGPDILKLILGNNSTTTQVAAFGFCYALASVIQRYLPATIMAGMFRPVFVAAHRTGPQTLTHVFWLVWKTNLVFVLSALTAIIITKDYFLGVVASGEYYRHDKVLLILAIGMIPISLHACLSMLCLAIEKSLPTFWSTLFAASCAALAPYATMEHGATGAAYVFLFAEATWCVACITLLAIKGDLPEISAAWRIAANIALFFALTRIAAWFVENGAHPIPIGGLAIAAYIFGSLKLGLFSSREIRTVLEIAPGAARIQKWMGTA